jgi:hypothetical protein
MIRESGPLTSICSNVWADLPKSARQPSGQCTDQALTAESSRERERMRQALAAFGGRGSFQGKPSCRWMIYATDLTDQFDAVDGKMTVMVAEALQFTILRAGEPSLAASEWRLRAGCAELLTHGILQAAPAIMQAVTRQLDDAGRLRRWSRCWLGRLC